MKNYLVDDQRLTHQNIVSCFGGRMRKKIGKFIYQKDFSSFMQHGTGAGNFYARIMPEDEESLAGAESC